MNKILRRSFGGLAPRYYWRQFFFGLMFPAIIAFTLHMGRHGRSARDVPFVLVVVVVLNTLLYPYARFVYESARDFIVGNNVFWGNAMLMLLLTYITMAICWSLAVFIAPAGLVYLYFRR